MIESWLEEPARKAAEYIEANELEPMKNRGAWGIQKLKRTTARDLQLCIRVEAAEEFCGTCECVTCGRVDCYKTMQAGHFIPTRSNAVLFLERHIHPQCIRCNNYLGGALAEYTTFMNERNTPEEMEALRQLRHRTRTYSQDELLTMRTSYRHRTQEARNLKGID